MGCNIGDDIVGWLLTVGKESVGKSKSIIITLLSQVSLDVPD